MMGYLHQESYSVESMMSTMNASNLTIMKDSWGNVYWPQFGLNNIGDLSPGQGYQIKASWCSGVFLTHLLVVLDMVMYM